MTQVAELPDGTRLEFPDDINPSVMDSAVKRHIASSQSQAAFDETAKQDSNFQNLMASIGGALSGVPIGLREIIGKSKPGEADEWKRSMEGLWGTPMGKVGTIVGGALPTIPAMMIPGVNSVLGAAALGGAMGAVQPTAGDGSRLTNIVLGTALGGAGQKVGNAVGSALASRAENQAAKLAAAQTANAPRDATIAGAQDAGYALPPSMVNPSWLNRTLEGFAGKATTAQQVAANNQNTTTNLVKRAVGLSPEAPLTVDSLKAVRADAGQAYEAVKGIGTMSADAPYANALDALATKYDAAHGGMKSMRIPEVESLFKDASKVQLESENAVEFLKNLRDNGYGNIGSKNAKEKLLGKTQLGIADAIEGLMDRSLQAQGQTDGLAAFRAARELIAKTYTVQGALNPATGAVNTGKLAGLFQRGKPLSPELETVGRTASAFPSATKEVTSSNPGVSPLDFVSSLLGSSAGYGATGSPWGMLAGTLPFARPAVRAAILSKPYQKAFVQPPGYDQSAIMRILGKDPRLTEEWAGVLGGTSLPEAGR